MPCYNPLVRIENITKWETAKDGHKYHPAKIMGQTEVSKNAHLLKDFANYKHKLIPCRNCTGCRLEYSRNWANRGYLEAKYHKNKTWFVTLTYNDENIPLDDEITTKKGITYTDNGKWNGNLNPKHFEKFIKHLRTICERENKGTFKYMGCGEYGAESARPHYHAILFGIDFPAETFYKARLIEKHYYWQNKWIERAWKYGISNITEANWQTIAYVARYITKKINGEGSEDLYAQAGKIKEFFRVSRGIGKQYYIDNKDKIYKTDQIHIAHGDQAIIAKPPKYFDELMKKENEEEIIKIKEKRIKNQKHNTIAEMKNTSLDYIDQLKVKEEQHKNRAKALIRKFEKTM